VVSNMGSAFRNKDFIFKIDIHTKKTQQIIQDFNRKNIVPWVSPDASLLTFTGKRTLGWDVAVYDMKKKEVGDVSHLMEKKSRMCVLWLTEKGMCGL